MRTVPLTRAAVRLGAWLALLAAAAAPAPPASAQTAEAAVSTRRLEVGERLTYTLTVRGGQGEALAPPVASGALRLLSQSPTLDITTSFNGETERRVAWAYVGTRPGRGRIGRLGLRIGGRQLSVDAVEVEVERAATPTAGVPPDASTEIFARAELSREAALVGQQVVVDYVLYFESHLQPRQTAPVGTWDAAGFWREEMDVPAAYPRPVTLDGKSYEAVTIRRIALFPTRAGTLELAPMRFSIDLLRTSRSLGSDPFSPFFSPFSSRYDEEEVTAPSATLRVDDLPAGAPPEFAGAVGQFEMTTTVGEQQVGVGEPVQIRVALAGTGNTATLEAPELEAPRGFDAYAPRDEREIRRAAEPLRGVKTFTYTLVPQGGGVFEVPPAAWTYFDPADGRYKTLRTDPVEITVLGPSLAEVAAAETDPNAPVGLMSTADWRRPPGSVGWLWAALGGGLALPALAGLLLVIARAGRRRLDADTPAKRRRRADAAVRQRLGDARALAGPAAYAEVERAVHLALAEHVGVLAGTLPRDGLAARLAEADLPGDLRDRTLALLDACARGQYAPGLPGTPPPDALLADAEAVLADLNAAAGPTRRRPAVSA